MSVRVLNLYALLALTLARDKCVCVFVADSMLAARLLHINMIFLFCSLKVFLAHLHTPLGTMDAPRCNNTSDMVMYARVINSATVFIAYCYLFWYNIPYTYYYNH